MGGSLDQYLVAAAVWERLLPRRSGLVHDVVEE